MSNSEELLARIKSFVVADNERRRSLVPVLSPVELGKWEEELGITLPLNLRKLYMEVGNGGFGPGYGFLSLVSPAFTFRSLPYFYCDFRNIRLAEGAIWSEGVVPISHWGDMILSCVDLTVPNPDPAIVRFDPNISEDATRRLLRNAKYCGTGMIPECTKLSVWLSKWLSGIDLFGVPYES